MNWRGKLRMLVLTRQEQRAIAFIVLMLVLGLATKHYRHTHSRLPETPNEQAAATAPASPFPTESVPAISKPPR